MSSVFIWGGLGVLVGFFLRSMVSILCLLWAPDDIRPILRRRGAVIQLRSHRLGPARFWIGVAVVGALGVFYQPGMNPA